MRETRWEVDSPEVDAADDVFTLATSEYDWVTGGGSTLPDFIALISPLSDSIVSDRTVVTSFVPSNVCGKCVACNLPLRGLCVCMFQYLCTILCSELYMVEVFI